MPSNRVYMGGVSHRAGERDVEYFLRKYGRLKDVSLKNGYAFIEFDDPRDAEDAVYDLHGVDFMGERVTVEIARGTPHGRDKERWGHGSRRSRDRSGSRDYDRRDRDRDGRGRGKEDRPSWLDKYGPPTRTEYRVTVENLSSKVSWQDLKDFMRTAGEVTFADAHKVRKNEGTVEFTTRDDMENAIDKLDDTELNGRRIRLIPDKRYLSAKHSPDGGRRKRHDSRSRSRSSRRERSRSKKRSRSTSRKSRSRSDSDKSRSRTRSRSRNSTSRKSKRDDSD